MTAGMERLLNKQLLPRLPLLLLVLLPLIACRKIVVLSLLNRPSGCTDFNRLILDSTNAAYNLGVLAPNYLEHGFVRRGLGGTIFAILGETPIVFCAHSLIVFHIVSAFWLSIPLALLLLRLARIGERRWIWLALVLIGSAQLFWAWGGDLGRVDMLTGGFIAWATLLALDCRYRWAAGCILIGSLVHEIAGFYGLPLIATLWALDHRAGRVDRREGAAALLVFLIGLAAITAGQMLLGQAGPAELARSVLRSGPETFLRDVAAYMTAHGSRGIATSLCQSFGRAATPLYIGGAYLVLSLYFKLLLLRSTRMMIAMAIASALPMAAISLVAVDYGRWLMMAVLNGWLLAAAFHLREPTQTALSRWELGSAVLSLMALFAMKPTTVYSPNQAAEALAARLWGPASVNLKRIEQCDPGWRSSIGLPPEPNYRSTQPWRTRWS